MILIACEKLDNIEIKPTVIFDPRDAACSQWKLGSLAHSPYKDKPLAWSDEFDYDENHKPPSGDTCYTRKPTCLRRLDWNSPDQCLQEDYTSIKYLNKCTWNVFEGYNFWTDNSTAGFSPNQIKVSGGNLHVQVKKSTNTPFQCGINPTGDPNGGNYWNYNCPLMVGALNSTIFNTWNANTPGKNVRTGRIEFYAKINPILSTWPALWLWEQTSRHVMTEIDIMENHVTPGETAIDPFQTLHTWLDKPIPPLMLNHYSSGSTTTAPLTDEYHTYGVERYNANQWTGTEYAKKAMTKLFIDDCYTREIKDGDPDSRNVANSLHVDDAPMFLILGEGVTKESIGIIDQVDGAEMLVDWVRVYE